MFGGLLGGGVGVAAEQAEDARDVLLVVGEQRLLGRVVRHVVVAVGHAEAALVEEADVGLRVLEVGVGGDAEQRAGAVAVELAGHPHQRLRVAHLVDGGEGAGERPGAGGLDAVLVHAGGVVAADAVLRGARLGAGGGLLQHVADRLLVAELDHREAAHPARLVGRPLGVRQPAAAGVLVEVLARIGGAVHRAEQPGQRIGGLHAGGWSGGRLGLRLLLGRGAHRWRLRRRQRLGGGGGRRGGGLLRCRCSAGGAAGEQGGGGEGGGGERRRRARQ